MVIVHPDAGITPPPPRKKMHESECKRNRFEEPDRNGHIRIAAVRPAYISNLSCVRHR